MSPQSPSAFSSTSFSNTSFSNIKFAPYWFDTIKPLGLAKLSENLECDLAIVGGGFTGLWSAIRAQERYPHLRIALFEASSLGYGGSGRNGGFLHASLTHGALNGIDRWPDDYELLRELGETNFAEIKAFVKQHKIECDWRDSGEIEVATAKHQVAALAATRDIASKYGEVLIPLDEPAVKARLNSPIFQAANFEAETVAMVNPAALLIGLAQHAIKNGVQIFENSAAVAIKNYRDQISFQVNGNQVLAKKVAIATNAFNSQFREIRSRIVPVFDYQIATRSLTADELKSIGWDGFEGFRDASNQFHYFRRTEDNRILFGGYDAVYYFGSKFSENELNNQTTYEKLAANFQRYFPDLKNITFEYAWGGAIDTCSRFTAFWGTKLDDKLAYVAGFTGLGVGASRFGADVMLDYLYEPTSPRLKIEMIRTKPIPFPPEPIRWIGIKLTQLSLAAADRNNGRRNLWLRLLDAFGLGFDS